MYSIHQPRFPILLWQHEIIWSTPNFFFNILNLQAFTPSNCTKFAGFRTPSSYTTFAGFHTLKLNKFAGLKLNHIYSFRTLKLHHICRLLHPQTTLHSQALTLWHFTKFAGFQTSPSLQAFTPSNFIQFAASAPSNFTKFASFHTQTSKTLQAFTPSNFNKFAGFCTLKLHHTCRLSHPQTSPNSQTFTVSTPNLLGFTLSD